MSRPHALVVIPEAGWKTQFDPDRVSRLRNLAQVEDPIWVPDFEVSDPTGRLSEVEVVLTGWGTPQLDAAALSRLPRLRAVLHCAGTVRPIVSAELWQRGILVSSSAQINAEPVAQFTLAAIIMAGKNAPFLAARARTHRDEFYPKARDPRGNADLTIGVVGFSQIGRRVVHLLKQVLHNVRCLVADPYADPAAVSRAGAELVSLDQMLPYLDILSIHAPELPSTYHMISAAQLAALPAGCCVVNTARGSLIDTAALEAECVSGRLSAILDVTDPEPLPSASRLYELPNVMITPHVAGSTGSEVIRMTDAALDELARFSAGLPLERPVSHSDLTHAA